MTDVKFEEDIDTSDSEHYITTKIEVYEVYKKKYDDDNDLIIVGSSNFESKEDDPESEEKHICSCGEVFDNRSEAHAHIK